MNEFIYNVIYKAAKSIKKLKVETELDNRNCIIVSDEHNIAYHICGAFELLKSECSGLTVHLIVNKSSACPELMNEIIGQWNDIYVWSSLDEFFEAKADTKCSTAESDDEYPWQKKSDLFFDILNLRLNIYKTPGEERNLLYNKKEKELKRLLDYNAKHSENLLQLITCIPDMSEPLPDVTHAVAEREYEVIFRDKPEDSPEKFAVYMENIIRSYKKILNRVQVIRLDRVFGPGIYSDDCLCINQIFKDLIEKQTLTIYDRDRYDFFSASYVRDAVISIILAITSGRKGNIYHVSSWELTRYQIISNIYNSFPEKPIKLETVHDDAQTEYKLTYRIINSKKMHLTHFESLPKVLYTSKVPAIRETGLWFFKVQNYIPKSDVNLYFGRMDRIRELELEILKEVDAICKKNNIHYFLTAGTMLGAVRHKGFIPWDDDVDIGMLPEDYEKFLRVCPESLSVDYGYQTVSTEPTSHYIHDKIRLKNSFFSTKFSDRYNMLNGVYIDIFIYYKTADSEKKQQRHIRKLTKIREWLAVCWHIRPVKKAFRYRIRYKISRHISHAWLDKYYRKVLMKYDRKNTAFRVDGGFNLEKAGAVPDEWFHGTTDAEFCGYTFPILKHYDEFLSHWYSKQYMSLLPITERKSVHSVVRIDLGQNLFDETIHDSRFRDVDLRGELYEVYKK